jgi:hypothetical protein
MTVINSTTLTSTTQFITFSSIPNTYKHLWIELTGRSDGIPDWFIMSFNGDNTGGNYFSRLLYADRNSATLSAGTQSPSAEPPLTGVVNKNTAIANSFSDAGIYVYNYTSSLSPKVFSGTSGQNNNADPSRQAFWENRWSNSAAISSIRIGCQTASSNNFVSGTTITLYGLP